MLISDHCPLCNHIQISFYHKDRKREYLQCHRCQLVFVAPKYLPTRSQEKQEYDLHQNSADDLGYRRFLHRLSQPLLAKLMSGSTGLDFGCGPGPALHIDFEQQGHNMLLHDPIYCPYSRLTEQEFDFITCTEAIEHFHQPINEWQLWMQILKPHGWLAIMTKRLIDHDAFNHWHYKNDQTHVCFFSNFTFNWLARQYGLTLEFVTTDIVLLQKLP